MSGKRFPPWSHGLSDIPKDIRKFDSSGGFVLLFYRQIGDFGTSRWSHNTERSTGLATYTTTSGPSTHISFAWTAPEVRVRLILFRLLYFFKAPIYILYGTTTPNNLCLCLGECVRWDTGYLYVYHIVFLLVWFGMAFLCCRWVFHRTFFCGAHRRPPGTIPIVPGSRQLTVVGAVAA